MRNARLNEAQAGIIARRNISNIRHDDDTTLMAGSKEELKSLLRKVKEESEWKSWLKTQHSKNEDHGTLSRYFMANRWGTNRNSDRLYFLWLRNHRGDCSHEIKTLAPWKKSYDQARQHIKKQKHYFGDKGPPSQSYVFPVVMYGCKIGTRKKAESWRIDVFQLWCWRRVLGLQGD